MSTILQQGKFTADGSAKTLVLRSDVDWIKVYNYTVIAGATVDSGTEFKWQRGMADNDAIVTYYDAAATAVNMAAAATLAVDGFKLVDTSGEALQAAVVTAATTNAVQPVIDTGDTTGMEDGTIVRLYTCTGQESLAGYDFEIDTINAGVDFRIRYAMANAPGAVGVAGTYRIIKWDPIYYPRWRFIANITQAASAVVTTTVQHGYTVGQVVRFKIPAVFDMTQLNNLTGTITAVTAATFTVDIDTTGFTAFAFALPADVPFSPATVSPLGEDVAEARSAAVNELQGATENIAYIGMKLGAGLTSPAGLNNDVIYWEAGKSFSVTNE